jgi:uncharacterized membrane protein
MTSADQGQPRRIAALDVARTAALAGMVVFHFTRDLEQFGLIAPGTTLGDGWSVFSRTVAGSFLFLSGVSLWLAHGQGIRWRAFLRRLAVLAAAAGLVSAATFVAMPEVFIYFGILHSIAVASVLGLAFLRLPTPVTIATGAVVLIVPQLWPSGLIDAPLLVWTGLTTSVPRTLDYEPVFPWFAPFLFGIACARLVAGAGLLRLSGDAPAPLWHWLGWPGRHSLAIYLIHQPVLMGAIWLWLRLAG